MDGRCTSKFPLCSIGGGFEALSFDGLVAVVVVVSSVFMDD